MRYPHDTFAALAGCILAGSPEAQESRGEFLGRCTARLGALPVTRRDRFALAVRLLGSRVGVLAAIGRPQRFASLDGALQARCLAAYGTSSIPAFRSAYEAVRRLVLAVHYARDDVGIAIGYEGPMHTRVPLLSWEGALHRESYRVNHDGFHGPIHGVKNGVKNGVNDSVKNRVDNGVIQGNDVARETHRTADVVVIGTGAGGAVTAARMAEAGFDVVMLEEGPYCTGSSFTEREAELTEKLYADGALRTTDDLSVALLQGRSVGGSTTVNWMIMLRTPPHVLGEWALHHGAYGMSAGEMAPVFDGIEARVHSRVVPDEAHSPNNRIILDGAARLGWRASSAAINASGCIRCGFCGVGCRYDAKQSTLVTFVPDALERGATLYADARVDRIEIRERDTGVRSGTPPLKRVHARTRGLGENGRVVEHTLTIDAPLVVMAAGAVGTPVLLQRSGLGGGGVGNWLRLHPTTAVFGNYSREIVASAGIPLSAMCDEFANRNGNGYGFWVECPPVHPSFTAAATPGFGAAHATRMRDFRQQGVLIALTRDGAERTTSSGSVHAKRNGDTGIRYRLSNADRENVRASVAAAARLHLAAGALHAGSLHTEPMTFRNERDIDALNHASFSPNRIGLFSAHVNGTCRMGVDPALSGATPDGERHGVRGLYITDGSLLPTAPGVNPQETIMAVASVLSGRMAQRHAGITRA